jgi:hypothetical protein
MAMSGRCRAPKTVKNRRHATLVPYRGWWAWQSSSLARLVAPDGELRPSTRSSPGNGTRASLPYVEGVAVVGRHTSSPASRRRRDGRGPRMPALRRPRRGSCRPSAARRPRRRSAGNAVTRREARDHSRENARGCGRANGRRPAPRAALQRRASLAYQCRRTPSRAFRLKASSAKCRFRLYTAAAPHVKSSGPRKATPSTLRT